MPCKPQATTFRSAEIRTSSGGTFRKLPKRAVKRLCVRAAVDSNKSTENEPAGSNKREKDERSLVLYGKIEKVFEETAKRSQGIDGSAGDWEEVEKSWVLRPPGNESPKAVVHFIGGAFVGASPQLSYRLFLEELASRGFLIVATPYGSGFDHSRISDEAQFKFDRCFRKLKEGSPVLDGLPVYGVGHSLGALAHLLIGSRYAVERKGNVLISFNNKAASMAIPSFSPVIAPLAKQWGPLIQQLTTNPAFKFGAERAIDQIRASSPVLLRQILPLLEQLPPLAAELADGKDEFTPPPEETKRLVRAYYGVGRNLLVQFDRDSIDETPGLAQTLGDGAACTPFLEMQVRTLPGDHARPLQQLVPELPSEISDAAARGSELLNNLAGLAGPSSPFSDLAKGVGAALKSGVQTGQLRDGAREDIKLLVDEVAMWMGAEAQRGAYLPSRSSAG